MQGHVLPTTTNCLTNVRGEDRFAREGAVEEDVVQQALQHLREQACLHLLHTRV